MTVPTPPTTAEALTRPLATVKVALGCRTKLPPERFKVPVEIVFAAAYEPTFEGLGTEIVLLPVRTTVPGPAVETEELPLVMLPSISSVPALLWTLMVVGIYSDNYFSGLTTIRIPG